MRMASPERGIRAPEVLSRLIIISKLIFSEGRSASKARGVKRNQVLSASGWGVAGGRLVGGGRSRSATSGTGASFWRDSGVRAHRGELQRQLSPVLERMFRRPYGPGS